MDEFFVFLVIPAIALVLSGPVALIISIIALKKANSILHELKHRKEVSQLRPYIEKPAQTPIPRVEIAMPADKPSSVAKEMPRPQVLQPAYTKMDTIEIPQTGTLEQRIGTKWVLIAGIITVIVGVGFFLKYAYDNSIIGPLGRVTIAAFSGLMALCIGEITRKRHYDIVAKAVTAMGFAILYVAVFSAYRFYGLIDSIPAFSLSILITIAAMLYAVSLNEILIAVLSLIGGFLTPIILSTGENMPIPLFTYVLILGTGAMLCAYYRKWRAVNLIAFIGTFVLYTGWFEKFFRSSMTATDGVPAQMSIALGWLGVFFVIYLALPLFNGLIRKLKAQKEDVLLVLANAAITFYYLWTILFVKYRMELVFCTIGLCAAHLIMMSIVIKRCKDDLNLRLGLLLIGLFFLTIAVPLYLKMYAIAMAWAIESILLVVIGLRHKSLWTQLCAAVAMALSVGQLINQLPMHTGAFSLILNPAFGTWVFVSTAIVIGHILYRRSLEIKADYHSVISQILHSVSILIMMSAVMMEWFWHCRYNVYNKMDSGTYFINGMIITFAVFTLLLATRPVCPAGTLCKITATVLGLIGSIYVMTAAMEGYKNSFTVFANTNFAVAILFVAGLFATAWCLRKAAMEDEYGVVFSNLFALAGVFVLWVLLSEQIYLYWYCKDRFAGSVANWRFLANMYISITWAIYGAILMTVGFGRKIAVLRYISLGLFGLLLVKVFILDMGTVKSVFRIAAFLATGITLVAVSYLYQYLKNKGFFETMLAERKKLED